MHPPRSLMFKRIAKYKGDSNELCKFLDFSLYLYSNFVYFMIILDAKFFTGKIYFFTFIERWKTNLHTKKAWR